MEGPQIASWETAALSKREQNAKKIPKEWILKKHGIPTTLSQANTFDIPHTSKVLNHKELKLTENYDATELVDMMSSGRVTSVEVVTAFCKRAAIAQQSVNCLTETMFEEAIARARECDEFREREGRGMGPLHGLPISLKVC
jgi:amidase